MVLKNTKIKLFLKNIKWALIFISKKYLNISRNSFMHYWNIWGHKISKKKKIKKETDKGFMRVV